MRLTIGEATQRLAKPSQIVRPGHRLTLPHGPHIRVVEIVALGLRRGPASEAQGLYTDLAPPAPRAARPDPDTPARAATRDPGAGRPTKRDRRNLDRFTGREST